MTEVQRAPAGMATASYPYRMTDQHVGLHMPSSTPMPMQPAQTSPARPRGSHFGLDIFSPVNQNGSFECDRVLKSGYVEKRTRKTKAWKRIYLVLRPNLLSIYKDQNEEKLRQKITLSELTAVAFLKDPKQKRQNVFGLFSPARNYHLEAPSKKDAEEWVELIRQYARIEEEEEEMLLASPVGNATDQYAGFTQQMESTAEQRRAQEDRIGASSPEPADPTVRRLSKPQRVTPRRPSHTIDYSGNELASHSDFSDVEHYPTIGASTISIPVPEESSPLDETALRNRPMLAGRNVSQGSGFNVETDPERVVWQGYLLYLKSSRGVRQWKELWAVLRPKNLALYKDESEYSPRLIIPLAAVINAVEIDPVSRTKRYCLQIITEEKGYRFCAATEETLDKALGAFKSVLARRQEGSRINSGLSAPR